MYRRRRVQLRNNLMDLTRVIPGSRRLHHDRATVARERRDRLWLVMKGIRFPHAAVSSQPMPLEPLDHDRIGEMSDAEWRARRIALFAECANQGETAIDKGYELAHDAWEEENAKDDAIKTAHEVLRYMVYKAMISEADYYFIEDHLEDWM